MDDKEFVQPTDMVRDAFRLARQIYDSGFRPDVLLALWRGGTPIAVAVHEFLEAKGVTTHHTVAKVTSYDGIGQQGKPQIEELDHVFGVVAQGTKVLVVDDIFDSGRTMNAVCGRLKEAGANVRVATLFFKPAANQTGLQPDFFICKTDRWVVFPHELIGLSDDELKAKDSFVYDLLTGDAACAGDRGDQ
jgi:hypoxanthine phosphoribosyltransferase